MTRRRFRSVLDDDEANEEAADYVRHLESLDQPAPRTEPERERIEGYFDRLAEQDRAAEDNRQRRTT